MKAINQTLPTQYPCLQTDRLVLTPFAGSMVAELHQIFTNPFVRRYLLDDEIVTFEWVATTIATSQKSIEASHYGLWAIQEKLSPALIGFGGYWWFEQLLYPLQLIYGLLPDYWGKGLATEAAQEIIAYGFEQVGFPEIVAAADIPNTSSFAVMERLGMDFWLRENGTDYYKLLR